MSKGILVYATGEEYVQQAILCALSCKLTNPNIGICLVTEDSVPIKFVNLFEHIIVVYSLYCIAKAYYENAL